MANPTNMFERIGTLGQTQAPTDEGVYNEKSQRIGRQLVGGLYMLLRSSKMYDPSNAIFTKPVVQIVELMNQIHGREGRLTIQFTEDAVYLNDALLRVNASSFENIRELAQELRAKKVFELALARPANTGDVLSLLKRLTQEVPQGVDPGEADAFQLLATDLAEKIKNAEQDDAPAQIDRQKYMLTIYARAIFFVRHYLKAQQEGATLPSAKALPIVQQLVDLCMGQRSQFVGLTSMQDKTEYAMYHAVNTTLLSIVFGGELGLTKAQLRDLGYAALFHDIGRAQLPRQLTESARKLTADDRERINRSRFASIRTVVAEGALTRSALVRIVVGFQHGESVSDEVKDDAGQVQMTVVRGARLSLFARIVSLCSVYDALTSKRPFREAYGPEAALMMMWTEMRPKFDPKLLEAFVRLMGPQQLEFLEKGQQTFSLV